MSKKKNNKKDYNDKYRLVPDDIVKNLVEFLDEIQFEAAQGGTSESIQVINLCNYLISNLINSVEAQPYKRYDRTDKISDHIIEFPEMNDKEFDKLVSQFDAFLKGWEKEYNKGKKINKKKKPGIESVAEYMSLEEIEQYLIDDPELTNYERFELYYDEYRRVKKQKDKGISYNKMLKDLGISPAKK